MGDESFASLTRAHAPDAAALFCLLAVFLVLEPLHPSQSFYLSPDTLWTVSAPHEDDTVPSWSLPIICLGVPLATVLALYKMQHRSRVELMRAVIGLLTSVFLTIAVTNMIKLAVGRPRPDFKERCWGTGAAMWSVAGEPICNDDSEAQRKLVVDGRKSFPSGHSSSTMSGLLYLSLYLHAKMPSFGVRQPRGGVVWRLLVLLAPIGLWAFVAVSRVMDHRHHPTDVCAGGALGALFAALAYAQHRPALAANPLELDRSAADYAVCADGDLETGAAQ